MEELSEYEIIILRFLKTKIEGCEEKEIISSCGDDAPAALEKLRKLKLVKQEIKENPESVFEYYAPSGKWKIEKAGSLYLTNYNSFIQQNFKNIKSEHRWSLWILVLGGIIDLTVGIILGYGAAVFKWIK